MKVLVIGSGGREHALIWKIAQSNLVEKVYCAPGNQGIAELAELIDIKAMEIEELASFARENTIDLTVVGPEDPLAAGIVDIFESKGLRIFGPSGDAAQLEGSKTFAKDLMHKYNIPTADFQSFNEYSHAEQYLKQNSRYPIVLKASGLAAGKGVLICQSEPEALDGLKKIMLERTFGTAGNTIVIEEFLEGEEVSVFAIADGKNYKLLSTSQDHKRVFDNDQGKNTGGMGAYAPAPLATDDLVKKIENTVIQPVLDAMVNEGMPYKGLLYAGLIITDKGHKVLEFNCRFGDPETEVVLPLLDSDLVPLLDASIDGTLENQDVRLKKGFAVDVVLASGGYPDSYQKEKIIKGLNELDKDTIVFHAGTAQKNADIVTSGGRVLNIVCYADTFREAQAKVYQETGKINFEDMHYRRDIGNKALKYL